MEIAPCFTGKRFVKSDNCCWVLFFSGPITNIRKNNQGGPTKDWTPFLWEHSGVCGGLATCWEGFKKNSCMVRRTIKWVTFKVTSNPEILSLWWGQNCILNWENCLQSPENLWFLELFNGIFLSLFKFRLFSFSCRCLKHILNMRMVNFQSYEFGSG